MHASLLPPRKPRRLRDDMIPMINIVFLLLIFFMVAGRLTGFDDTLVLPHSQGEGERPAQRIVVSLHNDGRMLIDGTAAEGSVPEALSALSLTGDDVLVVQIHNALPASVLDPILESLPSLAVDTVQLVTRRDP